MELIVIGMAKPMNSDFQTSGGFSSFPDIPRSTQLSIMGQRRISKVGARIFIN